MLLVHGAHDDDDRPASSDGGSTVDGQGLISDPRTGRGAARGDTTRPPSATSAPVSQPRRLPVLPCRRCVSRSSGPGHTSVQIELRGDFGAARTSPRCASPAVSQRARTVLPEAGRQHRARRSRRCLEEKPSRPSPGEPSSTRPMRITTRRKGTRSTSPSATPAAAFMFTDCPVCSISSPSDWSAKAATPAPRPSRQR